MYDLIAFSSLSYFLLHLLVTSCHHGIEGTERDSGFLSDGTKLRTISWYETIDVFNQLLISDRNLDKIITKPWIQSLCFDEMELGINNSGSIFMKHYFHFPPLFFYFTCYIMQKSVFLLVSPVFKAILNCIFLLMQKIMIFFQVLRL